MTGRIILILCAVCLLVPLGAADDWNQTMVNGSCQWSSMPAGVYEATGCPNGYFSSSKQFSCRRNATCDLFHYPNTGDVDPNQSPSSGGQMAVTPHNVKFKVTTFSSVPIPEVFVTAKGYETTVGPFDWLYQLIGIDSTKTPVLTSTMSGRTDHNGEIDFMMFETVKYVMTFERTGYTFDPLTFYPHDDFYKVFPKEDGDNSPAGMWLKPTGDRSKNCKMSCNTRCNSDGTACIDMSYMDLSCGSQGTCYLTKNCNGQRYIVDGCSIGRDCIQYSPASLRAGTDLAGFPDVYQLKSHTFTVSDYEGGQYSVTTDINHDLYDDFRLEQDISFKPAAVTAGLPEDVRIYVAIFLMLFVGMVFGSTSATQGSLVVCFVGWLFYAFGWFDRLGAAAPTALTLATIVSIFAIIMVRSKREQYR